MKQGESHKASENKRSPGISPGLLLFSGFGIPDSGCPIPAAKSLRGRHFFFFCFRSSRNCRMYSLRSAREKRRAEISNSYSRAEHLSR